ncbi:MAG: ABC transporter ATP-binding protein [Coprobacillaceae bacterium]
MDIINVENLYKSFVDKQVINGLTVTIKEGEIFGFLGPSGAGKTTFIKMMLGHIPYDEGVCKVLGVDVKNMTNAEYSKIGVVLDESGLYERLSCEKNLEIFRKIYNLPKSKIEEVLKRVGLLENKKTDVHKLSKGMKQRLVLARAIMHSPKLLFLDEPTSGLDPSTCLEIQKLLLELKGNGTTIFLTTHNMQEATELSDRVALLHNGQILECDSPENICNRYTISPTITITTKTNEVIKISNHEDGANRVYAMLKENKIKSIHSNEPSLGEVFVLLTGKELAL